MKYCKTCLQIDTRPNTKFIDGNCIACHYHKESIDEDFEERFEVLKDIIKKTSSSTLMFLKRLIL